MTDNQYLENLEGSPYLDEGITDYLKKAKSAAVNFLNKIAENTPTPQPQNNTQTQVPVNNQQQVKSGTIDDDFVKIVLAVSDIIIKKIDDDLSASKELTKKKQEKELGNIKENTGDKNSEIDRSSTTKTVAKTEDEAGGWLSWFHGHYKKYRRGGLPFEKNADIIMSNGKKKEVSPIWSNNRSENKIIVKYKDVEPVTTLPPTTQVKEDGSDAETSSAIDNRKEFVMFKFYDHQLIPESVSYKSNPPTISLFLHQANPYSKLIDRIKDDPRLADKSKQLADALYHPIELKWKEFKGHKLNPEKLNFKLNTDRKGIVYHSIATGKPENMSMTLINSILSDGLRNEHIDDDKNLDNMGLGYDDFISCLKKAGLKPEDLLTDDAKLAFKGKEGVKERPSELKKFDFTKDIWKPNTFDTPSVYDAYTTFIRNEFKGNEENLVGILNKAIQSLENHDNSTTNQIHDYVSNYIKNRPEAEQPKKISTKKPATEGELNKVYTVAINQGANKEKLDKIKSMHTSATARIELIKKILPKNVNGIELKMKKKNINEDYLLKNILLMENMGLYFGNTTDGSDSPYDIKHHSFHKSDDTM